MAKLPKIPNKPTYIINRISIKRPSALKLVVLAFIFAIMAYIFFGIIIRLTGRSATTPINYFDVVAEEDESPDENKPDLDDNYTVPADQPKSIQSVDLGLDGYIQKVGMNKQNSITAPSNIHVAGWFVDSVKPGDKGLSIIDGHVRGRHNKGVFVDLNKAKKGTIFTIEYGDGTFKNFETIETKQVPLNEASKQLFSKQDNIPEQLNLITCGGQYLDEVNGYQDRVIVVTKHVLN